MISEHPITLANLSHQRRSSGRFRFFVAGFTLLEVMIAMGILGVALLALLGLHRQSLRNVIHAQEVTRAAMLAQTIMSQAELERFPPVGTTTGNFEPIFPGAYPNYRWQRTVEQSDLFPDVCKVRVIVAYGANNFTLTEYLHNPQPPESPPTTVSPGGGRTNNNQNTPSGGGKGRHRGRRGRSRGGGP